MGTMTEPAKPHHRRAIASTERIHVPGDGEEVRYSRSITAKQWWLKNIVAIVIGSFGIGGGVWAIHSWSAPIVIKPFVQSAVHEELDRVILPLQAVDVRLQEEIEGQAVKFRGLMDILETGKGARLMDEKAFGDFAREYRTGHQDLSNRFLEFEHQLSDVKQMLAKQAGHIELMDSERLQLKEDVKRLKGEKP
jgi:hypothetical protein